MITSYEEVKQSSLAQFSYSLYSCTQVDILTSRKKYLKLEEPICVQLQWVFTVVCRKVEWRLQSLSLFWKDMASLFHYVATGEDWPEMENITLLQKVLKRGIP